VTSLDLARAQVADACRRLLRDGLAVGTAGNVSVRVDDLIAISPSGVDYSELTADLIGVHRLSGEAVDASLRPSSEMPLHLAIYRQYDVTAVIHTHAPASTAVSVVLDELPASHYYTAMFGGPVRVAAYATFGSDELADNVASALDGRTAAIMGNHGAVTVGFDIRGAYQRAAYLEYVCDVHLRAMSTGLPVRTLPDSEIRKVAPLLQAYGQRAQSVGRTRQHPPE
jgi:L-fuculose-phosphate aldolase